MKNLWRCVPLRISLSSRLSALGSAGLLLAGLCMTPAAAWAEVWQPCATVAAAKTWTAPRLRLGLQVEQWRDTSLGTGTGPRTDGAPKRARPPSQCRKWQSMALQLGETYAGYTLRHSILDRLCGDLGDNRLEETWDWPWAGFANGRMAPPHMVRSIEAWDIRCGKAGARQRCTMLYSEPAPATDIPPSNSQAITSHFVIDMVAGRESVLWRVFVPASLLGNEATSHSVSGSPSPGSARASTRGIRYRLGTVDYVERFSKCAVAGCIMEANLLHAGEVATSLWDGNDVALSIIQPPGRDVDIILPSHGFRAGLADLVRRRRDELRSAKR